MQFDQEHPSLYRLKLHLVGERDAATVQHIGACPQCQSVVEEFERRRRACLARGPTPEEFAHRIRRMAARNKAARRARRLRWAVRLAAMTLAAAGTAWLAAAFVG